MKRFTLFLFAFSLLAFTSFGGKHIERYGGVDLPTESFGFVVMMTLVKEESCIENCEVEPSISSASAVIVYTDRKITRLLTAGHVCAVSETGDTKTIVKDNTGKIHFIEAQVYSDKPDLCLLEARDSWGVPLKITKKDAIHGDRAWNLAAPHGLYQPGMVLAFEGLYSGRSQEGDDWYTIPSAPGSSGSPIINESGEIIGIIHSAILPLPHISLSSTPSQIKSFLKTSTDVLDSRDNQ